MENRNEWRNIWKTNRSNEFIKKYLADIYYIDNASKYFLENQGVDILTMTFYGHLSEYDKKYRKDYKNRGIKYACHTVQRMD